MGSEGTRKSEEQEDSISSCAFSCEGLPDWLVGIFGTKCSKYKAGSIKRPSISTDLPFERAFSRSPSEKEEKRNNMINRRNLLNIAEAIIITSQSLLHRPALSLPVV